MKNLNRKIRFLMIKSNSKATSTRLKTIPISRRKYQVQILELKDTSSTKILKSTLKIVAGFTKLSTATRIPTSLSEIRNTEGKATILNKTLPLQTLKRATSWTMTLDEFLCTSIKNQALKCLIKNYPNRKTFSKRAGLLTRAQTFFL